MKTQQFKIRALRLALTTAMAASAFIYSMESHAAADTTTLGVSADVQETCDITTTAVAFGEYDPIVVHKTNDLPNSGGNVAVVCTAGTTATILLDEGLHKDGTSAINAPVRNMANGTHLINYQIYQDSGFATVWGGDSLTGIAVTTGADGSTTQNMQVYAKVPAGATY